MASAVHAEHASHAHTHGPGCGHVAVPHGDHYDECEPQHTSPTTAMTTSTARGVGMSPFRTATTSILCTTTIATPHTTATMTNTEFDDPPSATSARACTGNARDGYVAAATGAQQIST
jgi:hypothetical protein